MNKWELVCFSINRRYRKGFITIGRQDILKFVYYGEKIPSKPWTVDGYRRMLQLGGYIETIKPGVYKILKYIPLGLKKRELRKKVYPKTYYYEKHGIKPIFGFEIGSII